MWIYWKYEWKELYDYDKGDLCDIIIKLNECIMKGNNKEYNTWFHDWAKHIIENY